MGSGLYRSHTAWRIMLIVSWLAFAFGPGSDDPGNATLSVWEWIGAAIFAIAYLWFCWRTFRKPRATALGLAGWTVGSLSLLMGLGGVIDVASGENEFGPTLVLITLAMGISTVGAALTGAVTRRRAAHQATIDLKERGGVVPLRSYWYAKPSFVVVADDTLSLVIPHFFSETPMVVAKWEVTGVVHDLESDQSELPPFLMNRLSEGIASFGAPYLPTTSPIAPPTVELAFRWPMLTPPSGWKTRFNLVRFCTGPSWPGGRFMLYGLMLREQEPGQLMRLLTDSGWATSPIEEVLSERPSPFVSGEIPRFWTKLARFQWLLWYGHFLALMLGLGVLASGSVPLVIGGWIVAVLLIGLTLFAGKHFQNLFRNSLRPECFPKLDSTTL